MQRSMQTTLIAPAVITAAILGTAQPALAQWGLYGFTADGEVLRIDHATGTASTHGKIGRPVVAATSTRDADQDFFVLTTDDRLLRYDRKTGETTPLLNLVGRPAGYEPVAIDYCTWCVTGPLYLAVVLSPPIGDDVLYTVSLVTGEYEQMWPTGQDGIVAMDKRYAMDQSGRLYTVDWAGKRFVLATAVTLPSPATSYVARGPCYSMYAASNDLWTIPLTGHSWQLVGGGTLGNLIDLVYADAVFYANCDPSISGVSTLNIFDYLCFQSEFIAGGSYACDCDTSTGIGVCDIFDFLCFLNAFANGSGAGC
jgi:hypothetical protein